MLRLFVGITAYLLAPAMVAAEQAAPAQMSEVHAVCIYEGVTKTGDMIHGGKAAVKVDRPGKAVTLFVSSSDSVTWEITTTPETKLVKVIVGGSHRQAANAPKGVEVVEMFGEGREGKEALTGHYNINSGRIRPFVKTLRELTGQELDSFQGAYRYDPKQPIVVDAVKRDERLHSDYPKVTPAKDLPKVVFQATHLTPVGRGAVAASFGGFTQAGPDVDSLKPLPKSIVRTAYDPGAKQYYGLTMHEIHSVDLEKGTSEKLDPGLAVPKVHWPSAITFDTKRERLLVVASKCFYEYAPGTGKWSVLTELKVEVAGLAYHSKSGTLYAIGPETFGEDKGKATLHQFNAKGAVVKSTELGGPMFPGILGRFGPGGRIQLVDAGDQLAALIGLGGGFGDDTKVPAETFLFLIDPASGKVKLAWKE